MPKNNDLYARFAQKHDIEANWNKATNFVPLKGEIIIYDPDSNHNYTRIKIGDGTSKVSALSFIDSNIQTQLNNKLSKLYYEWNKSYNAGGDAGYLLIGSFPMYDSNVTIDIDSTTTTTYHGTVIIATQNVSETSIGSAHTITVYGDPTGTISDAIRVVWNSGSRNYNVYFAPLTWSKNLIHIRALGNYLDTIKESEICTQFTKGTPPTTTSGLSVINALKTNFNNYTHPTTSGNKHIPSGGSSGQILRWSADGTAVWGNDNNTTYTNVALGQGYATCSTAADTIAKTATLSSYALIDNGIVSVRFSNDVPAGATLNINGKGAKAIYYNNAAITAGVIKAGDTATFIYNSYYRLISIDRWQKDIQTLQSDLTTLEDSVFYKGDDPVDSTIEQINAHSLGGFPANDYAKTADLGTQVSYTLEGSKLIIRTGAGGGGITTSYPQAEGVEF